MLIGESLVGIIAVGTTAVDGARAATVVVVVVAMIVCIGDWIKDMMTMKKDD